MVVDDDGAGLPAGFDVAASTRLGLQIVRTLVEGELRGTLALRPRRRRDPGQPAVPLEPTGRGDATGARRPDSTPGAWSAASFSRL